MMFLDSGLNLPDKFIGEYYLLKLDTQIQVQMVTLGDDVELINIVKFAI